MADLHISGLLRSYKAVKGKSGFSIGAINLDILEGESFAILGPSGCGKTTLLKCIAGLLPPDEGMIYIGEENIVPLSAESRGFSMVFQQPLLFPHMNVIENVTFGLKMQGMAKKERQAAAQEILKAVGLSGYDSRYPNELSGGQQQRVAVARAIVSKPRLLLLDEPFSALDPGIRSEMRQLVRNIQRDFRITMLLVTHDQDEAFELADRIAIMHKGELLQTGTPMDVYMKPAHPFVAKFIGISNVISGEYDQGRFRSDHIHIDLSTLGNIPQGPGWLVIRPELFSSVSIEEDYLWSGTLAEVKFHNAYYQFAVDIGNVTVQMLENMSNSSRIPKVGETLFLTLDLEQLHYIPQTEELSNEPTARGQNLC